MFAQLQMSWFLEIAQFGCAFWVKYFYNLIFLTAIWGSRRLKICFLPGWLLFPNKRYGVSLGPQGSNPQPFN